MKSPVLTIAIVILALATCQKSSSGNTVNEKGTAPPTDLADGQYYLATVVMRQPGSPHSTVSWGDRIYPVGINVHWNKATGQYDRNYFVDVGHIIEIPADPVFLPEKLDDLAKRRLVLNKDTFLAKGILPNGSIDELDLVNTDFHSKAERNIWIGFVDLKDTVRLLAEATSTDLTTLQRNMALDQLSISNHYASDFLTVRDVTEETVKANPSRIDGVKIEYFVGSHYARNLEKGHKYRFWAWSDFRDASKGTLRINIVYLQ